MTLAIRGITVEVNTGSPTARGAPPAINWAGSFPDGISAGVDGYEVETGDPAHPVVLDAEGYLIGGGVQLLVLGIGEFVHLRGSAYFELGRVETVPLVGVLDPSVLSALPADVQATVGLTEKELRFIQFGGQDVYAFLGVGGPHWMTEDPNDLTSDIVFECDPTQVGSGCVAADCAADSDTTDGFADADNNSECRAVRNPNAIGIAVSDLDFGFAIGTPVLQADPMRYYTLRASIDEAGLVGLEDEGLTAVLRGVSFEVNISTPTVSAFPLLPVIDWQQYAFDNGCDADDVTASAAGEPLDAACEPFGVKTGRVDARLPATPITEDFFYDGLFVRAAVRLAQIDVFGVLVARGSLAFVLGPTVDVQLVNGDTVTGVTTMTIGGSDLFALRRRQRPALDRGSGHPRDHLHG